MGCAISAPVLTVTWSAESIGFIKPILPAFYGVPINEFTEQGVDVFRFDDPDAQESISIEDVVMNERGFDEYVDYAAAIVNAWNKMSNRDLGTIAQEIANADIVIDKDPKETCWAPLKYATVRYGTHRQNRHGVGRAVDPH